MPCTGCGSEISDLYMVDRDLKFLIPVCHVLDVDQKFLNYMVDRDQKFLIPVCHVLDVGQKCLIPSGTW